jgi:hypothetical protein
MQSNQCRRYVPFIFMGLLHGLEDSFFHHAFESVCFCFAPFLHMTPFFSLFSPNAWAGQEVLENPCGGLHETGRTIGLVAERV